MVKLKGNSCIVHTYYPQTDMMYIEASSYISVTL